MSLKLVLLGTAAAGVLAAPLATLPLGSSFEAAPVVAAALTALMGLVAGVAVSKNQRARELFFAVRQAKPNPELLEKWRKLGTRKEESKPSRWRKRPDKNTEEDSDQQPQREVDNAGIGWLVRAIGLLISYAWQQHRVGTVVALFLFAFLAVGPISGVFLFSMVSQSLGLYLLTLVLFAGVTFITEPPEGDEA